MLTNKSLNKSMPVTDAVMYFLVIGNFDIFPKKFLKCVRVEKQFLLHMHILGSMWMNTRMLPEATGVMVVGAHPVGTCATPIHSLL